MKYFVSLIIAPRRLGTGLNEVREAGMEPRIRCRFLGWEERNDDSLSGLMERWEPIIRSQEEHISVFKKIYE